MSPEEIAKLQAYLRKLFGNKEIELIAPKRKGESVELRVAEEFIGTVHRDDEEGEVSFAVQFVVLAEDI
ncbi:MAG: DUF3126 family protein [Pseudomonadota bacterium]